MEDGSSWLNPDWLHSAIQLGGGDVSNPARPCRYPRPRRRGLAYLGGRAYAPRRSLTDPIVGKLLLRQPEYLPLKLLTRPGAGRQIDGKRFRSIRPSRYLFEKQVTQFRGTERPEGV